MNNFQTKKFEMKDLTLFECIEGDIWKKMEFNLGMAESHFISVINPYGKIVAILGLKYIRPGVAEVGIFRSKDILKRKLDFARLIKWTVDEYAHKNFKIHRLEIYCIKSWKMADKWAKFLGFQYEGICRAYDANLEDHKVYSRIYREDV